MSKKYKVFYITTYMKNGDVWQTKRGTNEEFEAYFSYCWKGDNVQRVEVEERMEELNLTKPEHII